MSACTVHVIRDTLGYLPEYEAPERQDCGRSLQPAKKAHLTALDTSYVAMNSG